MRIPSDLSNIFLTSATLIFLLLLTFSSCGGPSEKPLGDTVDPSAIDPSKNAVSLPTHVAAALSEAKSAGKIVMVELHDATCPTCTEMDRVFGKKEIKKALSELIHVKISPEDEGLIESFDLSVVPSFVFYSPEGKPMAEVLEGYRSTKRFAGEIENFKLIAAGKAPKELKKDRHPKFGKG